MVFCLPPPRWRFRADLVKDWRDLSRSYGATNSIKVLDITARGGRFFSTIKIGGFLERSDRSHEVEDGERPGRGYCRNQRTPPGS